MEIKPKFDTSTIKISQPIRHSTLPQKIARDPSGVISNGIYKVIRWERLRQMIVLFFALAIALACSILIILYDTLYHSNWSSYIFPIIILAISVYKIIISLIEMRALKKAVTRYRADLAVGVSHHPPFIVKIYRSLHVKQVVHNWLTFFLILHGGLLTLILWGLKDVSWWIFEFDKWIEAIFYNPDLMQWIFTIAIIVIALIHVVFTIQRKKRVLDIDAYFGETIISISDIEEIKKQYNKLCRRLFIGYILVILVIPLLVKWILKFIRRKK